jgi:isopentenyl phosphate kinase
MTLITTWLRIVVALLVMPVVAGGSMVAHCSCHSEVVFAGGCSCGHAHAEEHNQTSEPESERDEHRCTHVENELRVVSAEVELPLFTAECAAEVSVPDFRLSQERIHSSVALALERAWQWDPPDAVSAPLLI